MVRDKGILGLSVNFEPQVAAPLDARRKVALKADLLLTATWTANDGGVYAHDGMYTVVFGDTPANNGMWILSGTDYTDIGNWEHLSTSGTAVLSRFDTVANAEASTFQTGEICFIEETLGSYYYMPSGSDYTRDGDRYLNTGAGGDTRLVRYTSEYSGDITKDPTGFFEPENTVMSYDLITRTVTLSGSVLAFWRAKQVNALYSGWTSIAHSAEDGVYYLYYDGVSFIWSTELWEFYYLHIARVIVSNSGTVKFCIRECHGFTYPPTHYNLHQNIGTSRLESSGLLTSYVLDSTTAIDRRPDINLCNLFDEDLETTLPALTSKISYSWWYRTGTDTVNIDNDHNEIINLSVNQPYWNENVGGSWQQTLFSNNFYGKIFVLAVPTTSDVGSQKYRYIFVQPQEIHILSSSIDGVSTLSLDLGGLVDELKEFVFIAEITIQYVASNWIIKEISPIEGTRVSQVTVSGSAAALVAQHEAEGTHYLDQIQVPESRKVGTPIEALSLDKIVDYLWSAGLFDDTSWAWTDNLDGTVDIGVGQGLLREASTETSELKWISVPEVNNLALIDNSINYIYVDYNAGSPQILVSTNRNAFDCISKCIIYVASREGTAVHRMNMSGSSVDANRKYREKEFDFHRIQVVPGTAILNNEGTRYFSTSSGKFWSINEDILTDLLDTSDTDTYAKYYGSGVTWNKTLGHIQIDNLTYNDGTTTPATLGVGRFSAHFVFMSLDEDDSHLAIIVGGSHKNSEDALSSSLPASFPAELGALGVYIGTIVIEQSATEIDDIRIYNVGSVSQGAVQTSHNNLPGLQGGSSIDGEFFHLTEEKYDEVIETNFLLLASMLYVQSRLQNLVTNGNGLLNNNYNFSGFIFDTADLHSSGGSFLDERINSPFHFSTEYIPVDTGKRYRYIMWGKSGDADGGNYAAGANHLVGFASYDVDKKLVLSENSVKVTGSTDTTLAVDLNPGDPTITLTDATGWRNDTNNGQKSIAWYGYTNAGGYTYPDYTYTRNVSASNLWPSGGITGNVITLNEPWSGPALSAGDAVRNAVYSGYKYMFNKTNIPKTWTRYETYITKANGDGTNVLKEFFAGTAYLRMVFRLNRLIATQNNIRFDDFSITATSSDNIEPATPGLQGVVSLENQTMGAGKKTFIGGVLAKGTTSDSTANALEVENLNNEKLHYVRCDGQVEFKNYTFPILDGTVAGQTFETDAAGNITWVTPLTAYDEISEADKVAFIGFEDVLGFIDTSEGSWKRIDFGDIFAEIVANNPVIEYPSFRVHRNGVDQTVTSGVETLLNWTTKEANYTDEGFDLDTDRFTPTVEGIYTFSLKAYCTGATLGEAFIRKNGSLVSVGGSNGAHASVNIELYMNGITDYVEGKAKNTGGTVIFGASGYTYFSGSYVNKYTVL